MHKKLIIMKQYKHKTQKDWTAELSVNNTHYHIKPINELLHRRFVENSNDWELIQEEPNYTITAFKNVSDDDIMYLKPNGKHKYSCMDIEFSLHSMLNLGSCVNSGDFTIHSVKNSKGEEFSVADKVYWIAMNGKKHYFLIEKFTINSDNGIFIHSNSLLPECILDSAIKPKQPTIEVGKVYKQDNLMILLKEVESESNEKVKAIGFDYEGIWRELTSFLVVFKTLTEATKDEWFERLNEERIKRGLIEGANFKSLTTNLECPINGYLMINNTLVATKGNDTFPLMDSDTGKWATVIEEKKPILTTHDGIEVFEGDYCYRIDTNFKNFPLGTYTALKAVPLLGGILFSTPEKAQDYIDNNEKRYSLNDVRNEAEYHMESKEVNDFINDLKKLNRK